MRKKIIILVMILLGILVTPAGIYYSFIPQETHTQSVNCCKEQKPHCSHSPQQDQCLSVCLINYTSFIVEVQAQYKKAVKLYLTIIQNWYYTNPALQTVYLLNWVPPKLI